LKSITTNLQEQLEQKLSREDLLLYRKQIEKQIREEMRKEERKENETEKNSKSQEIKSQNATDPTSNDRSSWPSSRNNFNVNSDGFGSGNEVDLAELRSIRATLISLRDAYRGDVEKFTDHRDTQNQNTNITRTQHTQINGRNDSEKLSNSNSTDSSSSRITSAVMTDLQIHEYLKDAKVEEIKQKIKDQEESKVNRQESTSFSSSFPNSSSSHARVHSLHHSDESMLSSSLHLDPEEALLISSSSSSFPSSSSSKTSSSIHSRRQSAVTMKNELLDSTSNHNQEVKNIRRRVEEMELAMNLALQTQSPNSISAFSAVETNELPASILVSSASSTSLADSTNLPTTSSSLFSSIFNSSSSSASSSTSSTSAGLTNEWNQLYHQYEIEKQDLTNYLNDENRKKLDEEQKQKLITFRIELEQMKKKLDEEDHDDDDEDEDEYDVNDVEIRENHREKGDTHRLTDRGNDQKNRDHRGGSHLSSPNHDSHFSHSHRHRPSSHRPSSSSSASSSSSSSSLNRQITSVRDTISTLSAELSATHQSRISTLSKLNSLRYQFEQDLKQLGFEMKELKNVIKEKSHELAKIFLENWKKEKEWGKEMGNLEEKWEKRWREGKEREMIREKQIQRSQESMCQQFLIQSQTVQHHYDQVLQLLKMTPNNNINYNNNNEEENEIFLIGNENPERMVMSRKNKQQSRVWTPRPPSRPVSLRETSINRVRPASALGSSPATSSSSSSSSVPNVPSLSSRSALPLSATLPHPSHPLFRPSSSSSASSSSSGSSRRIKGASAAGRSESKMKENQKEMKKLPVWDQQPTADDPVKPNLDFGLGEEMEAKLDEINERVTQGKQIQSNEELSVLDGSNEDTVIDSAEKTLRLATVRRPATAAPISHSSTSRSRAPLFRVSDFYQ